MARIIAQTQEEVWYCSQESSPSASPGGTSPAPHHGPDVMTVMGASSKEVWGEALRWATVHTPGWAGCAGGLQHAPTVLVISDAEEGAALICEALEALGPQGTRFFRWALAVY